MSNTKQPKSKYPNEIDTILIRVSKGTKEKLKSRCKEQGISLNKLINSYIDLLLLDDWPLIIESIKYCINHGVFENQENKDWQIYYFVV